MFFIKALFFIKDQHHPKSVFNSGPKVGPALNQKAISMRFFPNRSLLHRVLIEVKDVGDREIQKPRGDEG